MVFDFYGRRYETTLVQGDLETPWCPAPLRSWTQCHKGYHYVPGVAPGTYAQSRCAAPDQVYKLPPQRVDPFCRRFLLTTPLTVSGYTGIDPELPQFSFTAAGVSPKPWNEGAFQVRALRCWEANTYQKLYTNSQVYADKPFDASNKLSVTGLIVSEFPTYSTGFYAGIPFQKDQSADLRYFPVDPITGRSTWWCNGRGPARCVPPEGEGQVVGQARITKLSLPQKG